MDDPKNHIDSAKELHRLSASYQLLLTEYDSCLAEVNSLRNEGMPDGVEAKVVVMTDGTPYCSIVLKGRDMKARGSVQIPENWHGRMDGLGDGFTDDRTYSISLPGEHNWNRVGYGSVGEKIPSATIDVIFEGTAGATGGKMEENLVRVSSHPTTLRHAYTIASKLVH